MRATVPAGSATRSAYCTSTIARSGCAAAEFVDAAHRLLELRTPVPADVLAVVRIAERARERGDQAAHRPAQHHRVAVQQREVGVGVHRRQRVERDRVGGLFSVHRPRTPPLCSTCSTRTVVLVGGTLVDGHEPVVVGGHVRDRLPRQALEVLRHHRDVLGRLVGRFAVHDFDARVQGRQHRVGGVDRIDVVAPRGARRVTVAARCHRTPSRAAHDCAGPGRATG